MSSSISIPERSRRVLLLAAAGAFLARPAPAQEEHYAPVSLGAYFAETRVERGRVVPLRPDRIRFQAVITHTMPLGNETHITEAERHTLGAWIAQGAVIGP